MAKQNILICSAGRRVSLVKAFREQAARLIGNEVKIFTTDLQPELAPACCVSDGALRIGRFTDPEYIPELVAFCEEKSIGLVVPTLDPELLLLADNISSFLNIETEAVISSRDLVARCRNKLETNRLFAELKVAVPSAIDIDAPTLPLFIKPIDGSSSRDLHVIRRLDELTDRLRDRSKFVHLEYLAPTEHEEYTVDAYFDRNGTLVAAVPRLRIATRSGEIAKGLTVRGEIHKQFCDLFSSLDGARGCITIQLFLRKLDGKIYGIEINPRFGGGYPLSYFAGADFPALLIKEYLLGQSLDYEDTWRENTLLLRYDAEMIVDDFRYSH